MNEGEHLETTKRIQQLRVYFLTISARSHIVFYFLMSPATTLSKSVLLSRKGLSTSHLRLLRHVVDHWLQPHHKTSRAPEKTGYRVIDDTNKVWLYISM